MPTDSSSSDAGSTALATYEQTPTSIDLPALTSRPAAGKSLVFINTGTPQQNATEEGVKEAATALGWGFTNIAVDITNPQSVLNGFTQALQRHPFAVIDNGTPYAEWSSVVPAYAKAGVLIIPGFNTGIPTSKTIPTTAVGGDAYFTMIGAMMGTWAAANAGSNGHILTVNVAGFPQLVGYYSSLNKTIKSACPGCTLVTASISLSQAQSNQGNPIALSNIQRDPSINTVVVPIGGTGFDGLSSALGSAGHTSVKWAAALGNIGDFNAVKAGGQEAAAGATSNVVSGWWMVDAALRASEGMSYPANYGVLPSQLLTSTNIGSVTLSSGNDPFSYPADFATSFKKAWHLSS